ncbi:hypothetical protein LCGC14_0396350 [marine sediment metagenome]|uniref:Uncharacterized protein n=1 Tax=marine sediment metagenome TaxID=412755 RepID=A0A0F9W740_9ZZZZ
MEFIVTKIEEIHDREGNLAGYQCYDGTGQSVKVKKGRDDYLKNKWPSLEVGTAYTFEMGSYTPPGKSTSYPYVQDFTLMSEALAEKIPPLVKEAQKLGAEVIKPDTTKTSIERAVALKGAIELASHDKIDIKNIGSYAKKFTQYLDTGE